MFKVQGRDRWRYLNSPLGYDPYDSQATSYLWNQLCRTMQQVAHEILVRDGPRPALEQRATVQAPVGNIIDEVFKL